jgi:hypothetical protein
MPEAAEVFKPLVELVTERAPDYSLYWNYWMGQNDLPVDTSEFRSRFGSLFENFRDNLARPIIKSAETRVRVTGFGDGTGTARKALEVWESNNMGYQSQQVHIETMVKGDGFVIVLPKVDGSPGIYPQVSESCAILYDDIDPTKKIAAIKWWKTASDNAKGEIKIRVNLYFDNRVERYISKSIGEFLDKDFSKYVEYEEEEGKGHVTRHKVGEVPMFEFNANYDLASARGRSDLADATPIIDAINKTFLDMMTASEFTAAPQRWATGVEIPLDPKTGKPAEAYKSGADKLWTAPNDAAKFGQFTPGELNAYSQGIEALVDHLTFTSATPSYALMKQVQYPSGEALRSAEAPLRGRVSDHQDAFTVTWQQVLLAALKLAKAEVAEASRKQALPTWLPVNAPFSTKELMEELKVKAETLGVPEEMLWREAGYTATQIEEMKAMREQEAELVDPFGASAVAVLNGAPVATEVAGVATDTVPAPEVAPPAEA